MENNENVVVEDNLTTVQENISEVLSENSADTSAEVVVDTTQGVTIGLDVIHNDINTLIFVIIMIWTCSIISASARRLGLVGKKGE